MEDLWYHTLGWGVGAWSVWKKLWPEAALSATTEPLVLAGAGVGGTVPVFWIFFLAV